MGSELLQAMLVDILEPIVITSPCQECQLTVGEQESLIEGVDSTYTLAAHRVTFRPSLRHSNSPLPFASALHFM